MVHAARSRLIPWIGVTLAMAHSVRELNEHVSAIFRLICDNLDRCNYEFHSESLIGGEGSRVAWLTRDRDRKVSINATRGNSSRDTCRQRQSRAPKGISSRDDFIFAASDSCINLEALPTARLGMGEKRRSEHEQINWKIARERERMRERNNSWASLKPFKRFYFVRDQLCFYSFWHQPPTDLSRALHCSWRNE